MREHWGVSVWILLHTKFHKINPSFYIENKLTLIQIVKNLCNNLPCSDCRTHANNHMKLLKPEHVNTKENMKQFLFQFHNDVNKRKNKPIFKNFSIYDSYNMKHAIARFVTQYVQRRYSSLQFIDTYHRNVTNKYILEYLKKHETQFIDESLHIT